jgi:polar amino acid transport system permease protein
MEAFTELLPGLIVSLKITAAVLVVGLPAGLLFGLGMFALPRPLSVAVWLLSEIGRGLPALVTLYFVYFGLPSIGAPLPPFPSIVVAFSFTTASYTAEIYRSALSSVPRQQTEGAQAIGLSRIQTLRLIIVPQALRIAILPLMGFAILIFQGTSLAFSIGITELMSVGYTTGVIEFQVTKYIYAAAVLYLVIVLAFEALMWAYKEGHLHTPRIRPVRSAGITNTSRP